MGFESPAFHMPCRGHAAKRRRDDHASADSNRTIGLPRGLGNWLAGQDRGNLYAESCNECRAGGPVKGER